MARRLSQNDPALSIEFFNSGFYTHRSQLFAPFKPIGVNVVSFHDPVIGGANMEDTDLFEWQRRPGFTKFCSVQLPVGEIVNQFDSFRNLNGTVIPLFDSSARFATFTPTTITTIVPKTTTAQGYASTLGNMLYFSDGAAIDYAKWDGTNLSAWGLAAPTIAPASTGLGFWYPHANFDIGDPIQDTNGNIEAVSAILIPNGSVESPNTYSELPLAGGIGAWGTGAIIAGSAESQTLVTIGHTKYLFFSDLNLNIPTGANILGISVSIPKKVSGGVAVDQSVKLVVGGSVVGTEHASAIPWSAAGFATTAYGGPVDTWSASLTAVQASTQGLSGFGVAIAADVTSVVNFQLVQSGTHGEFNGTSGGTNSTTIRYTFPNPIQAGNTIVIGQIGRAHV